MEDSNPPPLDVRDRSDLPPPSYTSANNHHQLPPVQLILSPLHNSLSFQLGHLGFGPASLQGEVQTKVTGEERTQFSRLEIVFRGVEQTEDMGPIELCESKQVVWGQGAASTSAARSDGEEEEEPSAQQHSRDHTPPTSIKFKLDLTPDLPHCIHFGTSSLSYSLTATLYPLSSSLPPISRSTPIHLVRTCPPGSLLSGSTIAATSDPPPSTAPQTLKLEDPIKLSVKLSRTVFRRSEPVELVARIEVPSAKVVQEEGLRLRTVSAELIRKVSIISDKTESATPSATKEEESTSTPPVTPPTEVEGAEEVTPHPTITTPLPRIDVLARSGKSCRFSPTRPIVIRLLLHPPSTISCESITQSTILHSITFSVLVTVSLFAHSASRHDCVLSSTIFIVPDVPSSSIRSEKQREVESSAYSGEGSWMPAEGPVPSYHESESSTGGQGSSNGGGVDYSWQRSPSGEDDIAEGDEDEEYDGYEEISESLSNRLPPPTIDEDVSPPSVVDTDSTITSLSISSDRDEDSPPPPTPPPNDFQDPTSELYDPNSLPSANNSHSHLLDLDLHPITISSRSSSLSGSVVLSSPSNSPLVRPVSTGGGSNTASSSSTSYPHPPPELATLPPPYGGNQASGEGRERELEMDSPTSDDEGGDEEQHRRGRENEGSSGGPPPYYSRSTGGILEELRDMGVVGVGVNRSGEVVEVRRQ